MLIQLAQRILEGERNGLLPKKMRSQLRGMFSIDNGTLNRLRYVSKPGKFAGRKTTHIRFYDPTLLNGSEQKVNRYADLDGRPPTLLFEGRITRGKFESTADYRPKIQKGVAA